MIRGNEPHSTHVRRQRVDFLNALGGFEAVLQEPKVPHQKLVRTAPAEFRHLQINTSYPITRLFQIGDKVMSYEATSSSNQYFSHLALPSNALFSLIFRRSSRHESVDSQSAGA